MPRFSSASFLKRLIVSAGLLFCSVSQVACRKPSAGMSATAVSVDEPVSRKTTEVGTAGRREEDGPLLGQFTNASEISAITRLPDGRFIGVGDEWEKPLFLLSYKKPGSFSERVWTPKMLKKQAGKKFKKLADLEGVDTDADGYVYAITSHSRSGGGDVKKKREKFLRFRVKGDQIVDAGIVLDLKRYLVAGKADLERAVEVKDVKNEGGFNIEALSFDGAHKELLVGLRSPVVKGKAVVLAIQNPKKIFTSGEEPVVAKTPYYLDLEGQGIRGMNWDAVLGGFTIISGPVAKKKEAFRLWLWTGKRENKPRRVKVANEEKSLDHAEGLTRMGDGQLLVVSDDQPGRFSIFSKQHLKLE